MVERARDKDVGEKAGRRVGALAGARAEGGAIETRKAEDSGLRGEDAAVELEAKKAAGYFSPEAPPSQADLTRVVGRDLKKF